MMQKISFGFLLLGLFLSTGCKKKNAEKEEPSSGSPGMAMAAGELEGETDPIANPSAVAGGTLTKQKHSFPKSLNMWLDYNVLSKEIIQLMYEPLVDLHSTSNYPVGMLATSWSVSEDKKTFTFKLNPRAKWSDGKPVTAEDVRFYYDVIMDTTHLTSLFRVHMKRFDRPEVIDKHTISMHAKKEHWLNFWEAASFVAFPRHVWKGKDFNKINTEFEVVSGPYQLKEVKVNRSIVLKRRGDWWGRIKKYNLYKYNFDKIRYRFLSDDKKAYEAFKRGDFDYYMPSTLQYIKQADIEPIQKNWIVRQRIFNKQPKSFSGLILNLRRKKFQDVRVREALCYLFNREQIVEKLLFNMKFLLNSYYPDLYPDNISPDNPMRAYDPHKARKLLKQAGWKVGKGGWLAKNGEPLAFTIMMIHEALLPHINVYLEDLKAVGIKADIERISWATRMKRADNHEFDAYIQGWGAPRLRDPEGMWHSKTAGQKASNNKAGVADPLVDSLIEAQMAEFDYQKREAILKRIDRRLNEIIPYVLIWSQDYERMLYWNRFGTPAHVLDKYNDAEVIPVYWWVDSEKEKKLAQAQKAGTALEAVSEKVYYSE